MPEVAKKKRIFQIAKELNISHMEIIQFLKNNGTEVESHMAPVTPEAYGEILLQFSKDKLQITRDKMRKEQARKVVVSKIQNKDSEENIANDYDNTIKPIKKIRKTVDIAASELELIEDTNKATSVFELKPTELEALYEKNKGNPLYEKRKKELFKQKIKNVYKTAVLLVIGTVLSISIDMMDRSIWGFIGFIFCLVLIRFTWFPKKKRK